MSNTGPNSYDAAVNAANQSKANGTSSNTSNWSYTSKVTYAANGGR